MGVNDDNQNISVSVNNKICQSLKLSKISHQVLSNNLNFGYSNVTGQILKPDFVEALKSKTSELFTKCKFHAEWTDPTVIVQTFYIRPFLKPIEASTFENENRICFHWVGSTRCDHPNSNINQGFAEVLRIFFQS